MYVTALAYQGEGGKWNKNNARRTYLERRVHDSHVVCLGAHFTSADQGIGGVHRRLDVLLELDKNKAAGGWAAALHRRSEL